MEGPLLQQLFNMLLPFGVVFIIICVFIVSSILLLRKIGSKVVEVTSSVSQPGKPRFRKRDKVMFYGMKMFRKVKSLSKARPRSKKVIKFAKRILQLRKGNSQPLQLQVKEPPDAYLEEDILSEQTEQRFPPEITYMLKSVRVFGFFEKPLFLELCRQLETCRVTAGNYLFKKGDPDDSIFVVQSGKLNVFITEPDGSELLLKEVTPGESIVSLLSFADVLTGHQAPYKTVSARAAVDSSIFRLPVQAFQGIFATSPETLVRVVQVIMVRLQRVTFTALHNYLGLSSQLIKPSEGKRNVAMTYSSTSSVLSPKVSPTRQKDYGHTSPNDEKPGPVASADDQMGVPKSEQSATEFEVACLRARANIEEASLESSSIPPGKSVPDEVQMPADQPRKRKGSQTPNSELSEEESNYFLKHGIEGFKNELRLEAIGMAAVHRGTACYVIGTVPETSRDLDDILYVFRFHNEDLLKNCVRIQSLSAGTSVIKQESLEDALLIYTLAGSLNISQKIVDKDEETQLYIAYPGELVGALAVLTGEPSFFSVRARHPSVIAVIGKNQLYNIMRVEPKTVLNVAHSMVQRLSPFVRQIDFSLDWINIESGRALYRQGEKSDCTYVVLSGRLRSVINHKNGKKELVGEYGRGDLVGIVELLTQTERSTTVMAVRATELAKLPEGLLNAIKVKYPVVVTRLIHLLGHHILGSWQKTGITGFAEQKVTNIASRTVNMASNFATVAILPASDDVPLSPFTLELYHSLSIIGPTLRLTNEIVRRILGPTILDSSNEYRLCTWLAQQEDHHMMVLYQCDTNFTSWTQHCIRQADVILIVAMANRKPSVGKMEKQLENIAVRTQKELVLLHREGDRKPRNTVHWLNIRSWCSSHHHIKCPNRMFAKKSQLRIVEMYNKIFENHPNIHSDFSRLARFLTGTSIGLVLGGGGARGAAHVGMIKAIQEAGIPIDMVGGVSIGAFMGGLWCEEKNLTTFVQRAREWSFKMTSVWRQILDLTYPATAMFTGAAFNRAIEEVFKDIQIEDLWLPYYTVTTDITDSVMRVHTHGSLWRYVRSSMSLSGYLPPLCDPTDGHLLLDGGYINNLPGSVWRYVRASMSIAGVFPPVCDPDDHHLLVDGAYVNIVPADIMKTMGAQTILAIDVGSQDETSHTNYGDTLSGWWLLWKRWNPWAEPVKVPSLPEIQSRLAYVSCMRQLEQVKRSDYCEYIRPPIDKYKTLQFGSFDEIMDVGYNHGKELLGTDRAKKLISSMKSSKSKYQSMVGLKNASFTDLAEMVCRIEEPSRTYLTESSEEDEYEETKEGYASEPDHIRFNIDESDHSPVRRRRQLSFGGIDCFSAPET